MPFDFFHRRYLTVRKSPFLAFKVLAGSALLFCLQCGATRSFAAEQFRLALPGYQFAFPRDHGSHPAFRTEWWYYTGELKTRAGRRFGYQLTFFRNALTPAPRRSSKWATRDVMLAHFALTDVENNRFHFDERLSRAAAGLAGAQAISPSAPASTLSAFHPRIWLYDWALQFDSKTQTLRATGRDDRAPHDTFSIALQQNQTKPPAVHGQRGVSQKSAGRGRASHYYSLTRLSTIGTVTLNNQQFAVGGQSWFDHEFSSNVLTANQVGWDWFSLQLSDGRELMLFQIRLKNGGIEPLSSGTLIEKDGRTHHLRAADFRVRVLQHWRSPHSGAQYPARWKLEVPRFGLSLEAAPTVADQELQTRRSTSITYWEGLVNVSGSGRGRALRGSGYIELTGYQRAFNGTF